jgi:glycosyltransferase involved in cell wall biosynthesis
MSLASDPTRPTVSFVVPCYKLAHLLAECVNSILTQTFADLEVLIMDDCSPDHTPEVARTLTDPRVRYIRNEPNLGSLRNYNKGIELSRGKYVWLISADDYLRRPYLVERYVGLMEANPRVGYVFCSGVGVLHGQETGLLKGTRYGSRDEVINGHRFLKRLLRFNMVLAPSGMVRRECYEKISLFPLEPGMIWSGDWYLWCVFALYHDVGFFTEPMVCYREHELSMTNVLKRENLEALFEGDIAVPWMIKKKAAALGLGSVAHTSLRAVAAQYALCLARTQKGEHRLPLAAVLEKLELSLTENAANAAERSWLRARIFVQFGDYLYWAHERTTARELYQKGLRLSPWLLLARVKLIALSLGAAGDIFRKSLRAVRG